MFAYDSVIASAVQTKPQSIADVFKIMQTIDATCVDGDGLKWFNWLYMNVTAAIENKVAGGGLKDPPWLSELDVLFARLYFDAVAGELTNGSCPECWKAMLSVRDQVKIARIQFAMAGMNAHINHDLPMAIVSTCQATNTTPQHGTPQYDDYTAVNATLAGLIEEAKQQLNVRLPGDPLPAVSHVEDLIATWDLTAFRETAWDTAQSLWGESNSEINVRMELRDTIVATLSAALLVCVP
jgi:Family of unknown function (DUF5995)